MSEPTPLRIDYRKINLKCSVCSEPATVIRFTQATDGEVYVASLCADDAGGEQKQIVEEGVLHRVEDTGTFINQDLYDKLQNLDAMDEIRGALENDEGGGEEN
jgi:hypothetical protein